MVNKKEVSHTKEIKVELIDTEGQMIREESDIDHIHTLALSINKVGLLNPINVVVKGGRYQLVAGFHRLEAVKELKWIMIASTVLSNVPVHDVKSIALVENIVRKQMTIDEECKAINSLLVDQEMSTAMICSLLGKSREYVLRRQMAMQLPVDVRDRLFDGDITLGVAEELGKVEDEQSRNYILWQAVQNKLKISEVRDIARIYLEAPTIQVAIEKGQEALTQISEAKTPQKSCDVCSTMHDYRDLINIWVCKGGCPPAEPKEELMEGK
ncbi:MAG: ParB/RepB/Spo0J family partition protein [Candidatus Anammoxibacter sp.]